MHPSPIAGKLSQDKTGGASAHLVVGMLSSGEIVKLSLEASFAHRGNQICFSDRTGYLTLATVLLLAISLIGCSGGNQQTVDDSSAGENIVEKDEQNRSEDREFAKLAERYFVEGYPRVALQHAKQIKDTGTRDGLLQRFVNRSLDLAIKDARIYRFCDAIMFYAEIESPKKRRTVERRIKEHHAEYLEEHGEFIEVAEECPLPAAK